VASVRRDPVSELFDRAARSLLARAYARPGVWIGTRLADPEPRHLELLAGMGINPAGPDPVNRLPGTGINARDRWTRGFVRAVYYQHRWYSGRPGGGFRRERRTVARSASSIEIEIGRRVVPRGRVIPAGRSVRIRRRPGGDAAMRAVGRLPDTRRIYDGTGAPASRWADPTVTRDWAQYG
jgi:hypothetical protein